MAIISNNIKAIIFDLDGTLVDAYEAIYYSFNFTMNKLGLAKRAKGTIRKAVGWGDSNLLAPFVPKNSLKMALRIYQEHHKKSLIAKARLFPYAKMLLSRLSSHYQLAVASNRPTKFSLILMRAVKISNYFNFILCADRLNKGKPHPAILKKILKQLKVKPEHALYVGDMAIDAQTAKAAKVKSIIVTTGSSSKQEIKKQKPFKIISKISQLKKIIKM